MAGRSGSFLLQRCASIFSSHRRTSTGYHVACVSNLSKTKQTAPEGHRPHASSPCHFFEFTEGWMLVRAWHRHSCADHTYPNPAPLRPPLLPRSSSLPHIHHDHQPPPRTTIIQSRDAPFFFRGDALAPRGASTPLWGLESCSLPRRWPNPIPAIPPHVVRTPHLHGAPTTEETKKVKL